MVGAASENRYRDTCVQDGLELLEELQRCQPVGGVGALGAGWDHLRGTCLDRLQTGDQAAYLIDPHQAVVEHPLQVEGGGAQSRALHVAKRLGKHEQPPRQRRIDPLARGYRGLVGRAVAILVDGQLRAEHPHHLDRRHREALLAGTVRPAGRPVPRPAGAGRPTRSGRPPPAPGRPGSSRRPPPPPRRRRAAHTSGPRVSPSSRPGCS